MAAVCANPHRETSSVASVRAASEPLRAAVLEFVRVRPRQPRDHAPHGASARRLAFPPRSKTEPLHRAIRAQTGLFPWPRHACAADEEDKRYTPPGRLGALTP